MVAERWHYKNSGMYETGRIVKKIALIASLLLMSAAAVGQTYSNANLSGTYSVQFGSPETSYWSKTFACPTNSSVTYTATGSQTTMNVSSGTATFDGTGGMTVTITEVGQVNTTASANTMSVTWNSACQIVSVNNGHVVYAASTTKTQSGTYSVLSNGTGTMSEVGSSQSQTFILAGTNSSGVSTTVLLANPQVNGKSIGAGIAVHQ